MKVRCKSNRENKHGGKGDLTVYSYQLAAFELEQSLPEKNFKY